MTTEKITFTDTITVTFGDVAENHVGMQKLGELASRGFSSEELEVGKTNFESLGCKCELINLMPAGGKELEDEKFQGSEVLVIRNGINGLMGDGYTDLLYTEQKELTPDKKAFMYGRVVNKHARWNLCYGDTAQAADYENGKGTIVGYNEVPILASIRDSLPEIMGKPAENLPAEMNNYYDKNKCGIGWHGDAERRKVIALRLGADMKIRFKWFKKGKPIGDNVDIILNHGDMYVMGEKAVGTDWKKRNIPTLRHAAGCEKYLR